MSPDHDRWLRWAERFDAWRVIPRLILLAYGALVWNLVNWAMGLPGLSTEQAGLVGVVTAMAAPLANWYMQTGRVWAHAQ